MLNRQIAEHYGISGVVGGSSAKCTFRRTVIAAEFSRTPVCSK